MTTGKNALVTAAIGLTALLGAATPALAAPSATAHECLRAGGHVVPLQNGMQVCVGGWLHNELLEG
ncbi:hypothetical protein [Saccharopolyspora rosea]|uniref:Secreted protein n=1 Tax=Saccharopolyspora rosea TaxID=524884 RepID=A0ABW3FKJ1_9PSEU|nr:hypothetical protein [Saccharopolyspora rosea]